MSSLSTKKCTLQQDVWNTIVPTNFIQDEISNVLHFDPAPPSGACDDREFKVSLDEFTVKI